MLAVRRHGMALADDGDLVRGVGFVAIYAAYLEETIDSLLQALAPLGSIDDFRKAQASTKIREIKKRLQTLDPRLFEALSADIESCASLLEARHEIIHGRIYAQTSGPDMLLPGRADRSKRPVTSMELYELANHLSTCSLLLRRPQFLDIPKAIERWRDA
jgi:hypothetical protein